MSEHTVAQGSAAVSGTPEHHALIVDADGACDFLASHPGWYIFPGKMVYDNGRWLKLPPRRFSWSRDASDDPGIIRGLWSTYADPETGKAPIAVHTGKSGLVVLDVDREIDDPVWVEALKDTNTLVLRSCSKQLPHYVFLQPTGDEEVVNQDWPAGADVKFGEVKSQNGYIFISDLPPFSGVLPLEMPAHLVKMLRTASPATAPGAVLSKMSDRDLELWLSTTECRLPNSAGEDQLIAELTATLERLADEGHRRDAMRACCLTLAIEATAGLYGAQKAWDALEAKYVEIRNDPGRNHGASGKEWSGRWWTDARTMLAGAIEKIEAGHYDVAIADKRDKFQIWSEEEDAAIRSFFEQAARDLPDTSLRHDERLATPPPARAESATESSWRDPDDDWKPTPSTLAPPPSPGDVKLPESAASAPPPRPTGADLGGGPASPFDRQGAIDPHIKLREELAARGADLDSIRDFAKNFQGGNGPHAVDAHLGKKVQTEIDRRMVRKIADSIDDEPVLPTTWEWLIEGGIDAIADHAPGTMLVRSDGVGLIYDRGVTHLIGDKACGKSWICVLLAIERMRAGETIVWLDYETDEQQVAERFVQGGATLNQILNQLLYFSMKGESIAGAVQTVGQLDPQPSIMIVDSVDASMAASGSEDENSGSGYHAWRNTITPLTTTMACVLIEHTGHENAHRARGSAAKGQQADMEFSAAVVKPFSKSEAGMVKWTCRKMRRGAVFGTDDVAAYLKISPRGRVMHNGRPTKIDHAVKMELLAPTDPDVASMALTAAAASAASDRDKVFTFICSGTGSVSKAKIKDATYVDTRALELILEELETEGKIFVNRSGRWHTYSPVV